MSSLPLTRIEARTREIAQRLLESRIQKQEKERQFLLSFEKRIREDLSRLRTRVEADNVTPISDTTDTTSTVERQDMLGDAVSSISNAALDSVRLPSTSLDTLTIKASQVVLVVESFSPVINLSPRIDIPPIVNNVDVRPEVTLTAPTPIVNIKNDVVVPPLLLPEVVNQITVSPAEIREVRVEITPTSKRERRVTIEGPNGEYTGVIEEK